MIEVKCTACFDANNWDDAKQIIYQDLSDKYQYLYKTYGNILKQEPGTCIYEYFFALFPKVNIKYFNNNDDYEIRYFGASDKVVQKDNGLIVKEKGYFEKVRNDFINKLCVSPDRKWFGGCEIPIIMVERYNDTYFYTIIR